VRVMSQLFSEPSSGGEAWKGGTQNGVATKKGKASIQIPNISGLV